MDYMTESNGLHDIIIVVVMLLPSLILTTMSFLSVCMYNTRYKYNQVSTTLPVSHYPGFWKGEHFFVFFFVENIKLDLEERWEVEFKKNTEGRGLNSQTPKRGCGVWEGRQHEGVIPKSRSGV